MASLCIVTKLTNIRSLIDIYSSPEPSEPLTSLKTILMNYASLLHHTRTTHSELSAVLKGDETPSRATAALLFAKQLCVATLHPRFLLFVPPLLVHLPAFLASRLGLRLLYKGEEETKSQYQIFPGGFALGLVYVLLGRRLSKVLATSHVEISGMPRLEAAVSFLRAIFANSGNTARGKAKAGLGTLAVVYAVGFALTKWHRALVTSEPFSFIFRYYILMTISELQTVRGDRHFLRVELTDIFRYKRLITSWKLMMAIALPQTSEVSVYNLAGYLNIPQPAANPYIQSRARQSTLMPSVSYVAPWRLMRHLLSARRQALSSVKEFAATRDRAWLAV